MFVVHAARLVNLFVFVNCEKGIKPSSFILNLGIRFSGMVNVRDWQLLHGEINWWPLDMRLGGLQRWVGCSGEQKNL